MAYRVASRQDPHAAPDSVPGRRSRPVRIASPHRATLLLIAIDHSNTLRVHRPANPYDSVRIVSDWYDASAWTA